LLENLYYSVTGKVQPIPGRSTGFKHCSIALRAALGELSIELPGKHSISTYSGCLRSAGLLTVQDVKDIEQMGGLRNSAAHGQLEDGAQAARWANGAAGEHVPASSRGSY
jgi:hypothetical protein